MEYFIKLKSENKNLIQIDGFLKKVIDKNSFLTFSVDLNFNENFVINVEPLEKDENLYFAYKIFVESTSEGLKVTSPNIEVLSYDNYHIITLKSLIAVKNVSVLSSTNSYSVFNTTVTNITTKNATILLPKIFNLTNTKKVGGNTVLCFETPSKTQNFVVVLFNDEIIFKDYFNNINLNNKIEILSNLNDIAKHSILTTIENKNITQKTVYCNNEPKLTFCPQVIPLAFLQALKLDNIKLCKYYLSENLKNVASLEMLKTYFSNYKKVEFDNNKYILFYPDGSHKICNFSLENNKICKIDLI